jgi:hypothetical protein
MYNIVVLILPNFILEGTVICVANSLEDHGLCGRSPISENVCLYKRDALVSRRRGRFRRKELAF